MWLVPYVLINKLQFQINIVAKLIWYNFSLQFLKKKLMWDLPGAHLESAVFPHTQENKVPVYRSSFHGFVGNCSYLMVTGPNEHIAFPNPESKSSPQAATEPGRSLWSRRFKVSVSPGPAGWAEWSPHSPSAGCTCTGRGSSNRGRRRSRSCTDPTTCRSSPAQSRDSELSMSNRAKVTVSQHKDQTRHVF